MLHLKVLIKLQLAVSYGHQSWIVGCSASSEGNQEYDLLLLPLNSVAGSIPYSKSPYFHSSNQEQTSQDPEKMPATLTWCGETSVSIQTKASFSPYTNRLPHFWEALYISPSEETLRVLLWHTQRQLTGPDWTSRAHANTLLSSKQIDQVTPLHQEK